MLDQYVAELCERLLADGTPLSKEAATMLETLCTTVNQRNIMLSEVAETIADILDEQPRPSSPVGQDMQSWRLGVNAGWDSAIARAIQVLVARLDRQHLSTQS